MSTTKPTNSSAATATPLSTSHTAAMGKMSHNSIVLLRQPYKNIIKWISHVDKNILCYWILKSNITLQQVDKIRNDCAITQLAFDPNKYCDCVYILSSEIKEIDFVLQQYMDLLKGNISLPLLPGDIDDDEFVFSCGGIVSKYDLQKDHDCNDSEKDMESIENTSDAGDGTEKLETSTRKKESNNKVSKTLSPPTRKGSIAGFFSDVFGGLHNASEGEGDENIGGVSLQRDESNESHAFGDDTAGVGNSIFRSLYGSTNTKGGGVDGEHVVSHASTLSELNKLCLKPFDDEENEEDDGSDDDIANPNIETDESDGESDTKKDDESAKSKLAENINSKKGGFLRGWL